MRWLAALVAFALSGCGGDCAPGPNIQLTLVASPLVDSAAIAKLHIVLSIDGMQPRSADLTPMKTIGTTPVSLLLVPDPMPPAQKYNVALTVEAVNATGAIMAYATAEGDVVANGCNRLQTELFPLGGPPPPGIDGGGGSGGQDGFVYLPDLLSTDMSQCVVVNNDPDKDQDGRPDRCDLCPDDYDPVPTDSDLDGLPDACDPDPARPTNTGLYFDPFYNPSDTQWSTGMINQNQDYLSIDTNGPGAVVSANPTVSLPVNVRLQTHAFNSLNGFYPGGNTADIGLFLGNSSNPGGANTAGVLCTLNANSQGPDSVNLYTVTNGTVNGQPTSTPFAGGFQPRTMYRIRLTQRGATYTCEAAALDYGPLPASESQPVSVTKTMSAAPTAPQFMAVHAQALVAHVHSVVAESVLP